MCLEGEKFGEMEWFTYEKEEDDGLTEISLDWGDFDEVKVSEKTDNLADGLVSCLNALGRVDVPYIATACDKTPQEVVDELEDIFGNMGLDIAPCSVDSDGNVTAPSES